MALRSVYLRAPSFEDNLVRLAGEEHRHLVVSRAATGELIEVFDGMGNVWTAAIRAVGKRDTAAQVVKFRRVERDEAVLILAQALIRTATFELALEKAVELGVTRIVPFVAARSNVTAARRQDRWMRIVIEAAKQSKRYHLPELEGPLKFDQVISMEATSKILFAEHGGGPLKSAVLGSPALYMVGPEGGWTTEELTAARARGFAPVSLGTGLLKAETAAIVGTALIRYELAASHLREQTEQQGTGDLSPEERR